MYRLFFFSLFDSCAYFSMIVLVPFHPFKEIIAHLNYFHFTPIPDTPQSLIYCMILCAVDVSDIIEHGVTFDLFLSV